MVVKFWQAITLSRAASGLAYGLVLGLVSLFALSSVDSLGSGVSSLFDEASVGVAGGQRCTAGEVDGIAHGDMPHRGGQTVREVSDASSIPNATAAETEYRISCNNGVARLVDTQIIVTACAAEYEIQGNSCQRRPAIVSVDPTSLMASITDGISPGPAATATVTNTGSASSGVLSLQMTTGAAAFTILDSSSCESGVTTLAPNASCSVDVARVAGADEASATGSLSVGFANATDDVTVSLAGAASGFTPVVSVAPGALTAAITNGLSPGPAATLTVTNTGTLNSGLLSVQLSSGAADFTILGSGSCVAGVTTLDANAACTIDVARIASANAANASGTLTVGFAGAAAAVDIPLSGAASGFDPVISLLANDGVSAPDGSGFEVTASGCVAPGGSNITGSSRTYQISNTGTVATQSLAISLSSGNDFTVSDTCPTALAPAASCTATVTPQANNTRSLSATLSVTASNLTPAVTLALNGAAAGFTDGGVTATDDTYSGLSNGDTGTFDVTANDCGSGLEVISVSGVSNGYVNFRNSSSSMTDFDLGSLTYAITQDTYATDTFTYCVRDSGGNTDCATVTLTLNQDIENTLLASCHATCRADPSCSYVSIYPSTTRSRCGRCNRGSNRRFDSWEDYYATYNCTGSSCVFDHIGWCQDYTYYRDIPGYDWAGE